MKFENTPFELQGLANSLAKHYEDRRFKVFPERVFSEEAPFRTTLFAQKGSEVTLVEAQSRLVIGSAFTKLLRWLDQNRRFASVSIAVPSESDIPAQHIRGLKNIGAGLLVLGKTVS